MNSKKKGSRGELELSHKLNDLGFHTRRGQQYSGIEGEDVVGLDGVHIECKRVEKLNVDKAMEQAIKDGHGEIPIVCHRKNRKDWLVTMRLEDWVELYRSNRREIVRKKDMK